MTIWSGVRAAPFLMAPYSRTEEMGVTKRRAIRRSGRKRATTRAVGARSPAKRSAARKSTRTRSKRAPSRQSARTRTTAKSKGARKKTAATAVRGAVAGAVVAVTKRLPWSSADQDAITLLEVDHRRFKDLLKQGEETTERAVKGRAELLKTLTAELNLHELVEEKILYPALKAHPEARDIVLEGYQEHHIADVLTRELHGLPPGDERWAAKFKVLKESLEHHIQEEEGEMFRTARGIFSREDLLRLGAEMTRMKTESRT
jgi:hemerythrin-like domain-containing protein